MVLLSLILAAKTFQIIYAYDVISQSSDYSILAYTVPFIVVNRLYWR
jgi:hypothetical protein